MSFFSERRAFFKKIFSQLRSPKTFAWLSLLFGKAHAANWSKVGSTSGTASTWQKITRSAPKVSAIVAGEYMSAGLLSDGTIVACGYTRPYALTSAASSSYNTFIASPGVSNVAAIALDSAFWAATTLALRSDGVLIGRGNNGQGKFGDGSAFVDLSNYTQVGVGMSNIAALSASTGCTMLLNSSGEVYVSGANGNGQLGIGLVGSQSSFVKVTALSNIVSISMGDGFAAAIRSDGLVFAAGKNNRGQLGDGTGGSDSYTYVQALGISNAVAIYCGIDRTAAAIRADGLVFSSGDNAKGQVGDNSTTHRYSYVQCTGISNAVAVSVGQTHAVALRSDGLVFATGENLRGELGINSNTSVLTYIQCTGISNAIAVAAGFNYSLALRADGVIFGCGSNSFGRIGAGTTASHLTFVQVY